ncbi:MAG: hypothetical protein E3J58_06270 [Actinomycetota bacterium]|nr:MAG: hypothetical protein E3J58_06270 [Actinomycetota bacterium]
MKKILLIIFIILLSFFSVSGCKVTGEINKEEIYPTEKSEKDLESEAKEELLIVEEKEEISEIISISPTEVYEII